MDKILAALTESLGEKIVERDESVFYVNEDFSQDLRELTPEMVTALVAEDKVAIAADLDKVIEIVNEAADGKQTYSVSLVPGAGSEKKIPDAAKYNVTAKITQAEGAGKQATVSFTGRYEDVKKYLLAVDFCPHRGVNELLESDDSNNFFKDKKKEGGEKETAEKEDTSEKEGGEKAEKSEKKSKKDDVQVKEAAAVEADNAAEALSESIKAKLLEEGLWDVAEENAEIIAKRKSLVETMIAEEKFERGERDFTVEFFAESFEDAGDMSSLEKGDIVYESAELSNGQKLVRIKYNADKAELVEGFLEEQTGGSIDAHIVDGVTGKSLIGILGESFSSEEINTVVNLFNTAVSDRVGVIREGLEESIKDRAKIAVDAAVGAIDSVMEEVIAEWVEENRPAIVDSVKVSSMSELVKGVKSVFESFGVHVVEKDADIIESLVKENAEFKGAQTTLSEENATLKSELNTMKAEAIFEANTKDMSMTQKEKMKSLLEGVSTENAEAYEGRVKLVAESFFSGKTPSKKTLLEGQSDDVLSEGAVKIADPKVDPYADFLRRSNPNRVK